MFFEEFFRSGRTAGARLRMIASKRLLAKGGGNRNAVKARPFGDVVLSRSPSTFN
jgi:hypothetical protein